MIALGSATPTRGAAAAVAPANLRDRGGAALSPATSRTPGTVPGSSQDCARPACKPSSSLAERPARPRRESQDCARMSMGRRSWTYSYGGRASHRVAELVPRVDNITARSGSLERFACLTWRCTPPQTVPRASGRSVRTQRPERTPGQAAVEQNLRPRVAIDSGPPTISNAWSCRAFAQRRALEQDHTRRGSAVSIVGMFGEA